jgi:hypothetical protein
VQHQPSGYNDTPSVDALLNHLGKQTGVQLEAEEKEIAWYDGDRTSADYADSPANITE